MNSQTLLARISHAHPLSSPVRPSTWRSFRSITQARSFHKSMRIPSLTASQARRRPAIEANHRKTAPTALPSVPTARTIFIQTQSTPNADALKFVPNQQVLPDGFPSTFIEYTSPRSTLAPPHPSQLASKLLNVDGVSSVFYGSDFITITKASDVNWAHVKPEVFSLITEAISSGENIVNSVEQGARVEGQATGEEDSLVINDEDDEVVAMIKELLETRIRPAIQEDGGDIEFRGFEDGMVNLKLRGACRTCDSSTVTLKNGIESMLMHYIEEVKGVNQVLDEEEQIAIQEFAKFEEKLKSQKGSSAAASTVEKSSFDAAA